MPLSKYKLTYWDVRGRAEPIRLIFAAAKVQFFDHRIKKDVWPELKQAMPWSQVPVLYVDGKALAQSMTICRYLAREFGLVGKNEWESAKCDEFVDASNDLVGEMKKIAHAKTEDIKGKLKAEFLANTAPKFMNKTSQFIDEGGSNYLVGEQLTWADIVVVTTLERLEKLYEDPHLLNKYPVLNKLKETVFSHEGVNDWIEKRPQD